MASAAPPAQNKAKPGSNKVPWAKIDATVNGYFSALPGHQASDMISRKQVEPVLTKLAVMGWKVPDQEKLLAKVPADSSWLVTNLRTPNGKKFMRKIAGYPQGYDRTDRLTALSDGRRIVSALIQGPGGEEMIAFLTTSRTGKNTSKELTLVPGGADFNKPTGKLYTVDALLAELSVLYAGGVSAPPAPTPAAKRARSSY
ncbi:MAG: hypothetical protein K8T91_07420 [Planctomycetes bacterium]|nr:hypothetical protein [Planctomycetota bacterium]